MPPPLLPHGDPHTMQDLLGSTPVPLGQLALAPLRRTGGARPEVGAVPGDQGAHQVPSSDGAASAHFRSSFSNVSPRASGMGTES